MASREAPSSPRLSFAVTTLVLFTLWTRRPVTRLQIELLWRRPLTLDNTHNTQWDQADGEERIGTSYVVFARAGRKAVDELRAGTQSVVRCTSATLQYTLWSVYTYVIQHNQWTSSQQFYNLLYNTFTTNGQKFATFQHLDMWRCWALALRCGKFVVQQVVELLWARPLVVLYNMFVADVVTKLCASFGQDDVTLRAATLERLLLRQ